MPGSVSPSSMRLGLGLVIALGLIIGGCAAPPAPVVSAAGPFGPATREDAGPQTFAPDEVDRPARPVAPIEPVYPRRLRAMGVEGEVEADVIVLADGSVGGAKITASSDEAFSGAVRDSLRVARFHPAERAGRPVASWVSLHLHFRLD